MWGSFGFGIGAFLAGSFVDHAGKFFVKRGLSRYTAAFSLSGVLQLLALPMILYLLGKMPSGTKDGK